MSKATSTAIFAAVPGILGLGAIYWLSFAGGVHELHKVLHQDERAQVQERRAAEIVASPEPQVAPMKIILQPGAARITRASGQVGLLSDNSGLGPRGIGEIRRPAGGRPARPP